jgi:cytochrome P450
MLAITERVLDRAPQGTVSPLLGPMQDITLRVILRCLFGVAEGPRFEELRALVVEYLQRVFALDVVAFGALLTPTRAYRALARLSRRAQAAGPAGAFTPSALPVLRVADRMGRIRAILDAEIDRCLAEGPETRGDVLALMLRARFADGQPIARDELLAQLFMLVIGGYETTSLTLCWAVHCLVQHPEAVARVRAELADVMGEGFDPARVRDLHYLGAVIAESMRLHPIAIGVSRRLRQPMQLAGRDLPAGTIVMSSIYLVQRHPDLWPEPEAFRPERMLERKPSATVHFPFGAGVWRCLGAAFAEHEMRIVLARLFTRFDVVADPTAPIHAQQRGIAVGPAGGLPVRLLPRA